MTNDHLYQSDPKCTKVTLQVVHIFPTQLHTFCTLYQGGLVILRAAPLQTTLTGKKKTLNPTLFEPYGNHAQAVATAHPSGRRHVALGSIEHFRIISKMPWREPWLLRALRGAATSRFAIWQTSRSFYKMFPALKRQRSSKDFPFQTALEWFQDEKAKQVASRQALRELPSELEQEIMNFTFDYVLRSLFK